MFLLESFTTLLRDPAHWQFELLVGLLEALVLDVIIGALLWPRIKGHFHRDIDRSEQIDLGTHAQVFERLSALSARVDRVEQRPITVVVSPSNIPPTSVGPGVGPAPLIPPPPVYIPRPMYPDVSPTTWCSD